MGGHIRETIAPDIILQKLERARIRFKSLDSGLGIKPFEVKRSHTYVGAAIEDYGGLAGGPKQVNLAGKDIVVQQCEALAIEAGDLKAQHFFGRPDQVESQANLPRSGMRGLIKKMRTLRELR